MFSEPTQKNTHAFHIRNPEDTQDAHNAHDDARREHGDDVELLYHHIHSKFQFTESCCLRDLHKSSFTGNLE